MRHPSPDQARASLDDVRRMEADLADRMLTPWWLYPAWGLAEALIVAVRHQLRHGVRTR
ncbi:MAG TPA: hypothetical protein VIJ15_01005 [Dermatophilaceae bacterium]